MQPAVLDWVGWRGGNCPCFNLNYGRIIPRPLLGLGDPLHLLLARDWPLRFAFAGPVLLLLTLPGPAVPLVVVATPGMRPEDRRRTSAPAGGGGDANDAAMWTSSAPAATAGRLQDMAAGAVTRQVVLAETGPAA